MLWPPRDSFVPKNPAWSVQSCIMVVHVSVCAQDDMAGSFTLALMLGAPRGGAR